MNSHRDATDEDLEKARFFDNIYFKSKEEELEWFKKHNESKNLILQIDVGFLIYTHTPLGVYFLCLDMWEALKATSFRVDKTTVVKNVRCF
ncbi:hypothetical protein CD133_10105 [Staphylococcus massiliensis CCUG 55927]|nr:hypothetical protein CD133_10105 [Staphylococcus massiliensis CCUG 55927]